MTTRLRPMLGICCFVAALVGLVGNYFLWAATMIIASAWFLENSP